MSLLVDGFVSVSNTKLQNRPLRGTRLFLLLYPFRSKKTIARKTISKTKEKSAKVKKMTEQASYIQEQLIKTILQ